MVGEDAARRGGGNPDIFANNLIWQNMELKSLV